MDKKLNWMAGLSKRLSSLSTMSALGGGGLALLLMAWVTMTVFARYVINKPIPSSDEVSGFMFLGIVFLGMGYALLSEGHIRLDLILTRLGGRVRYSLEIVWSLFGLAFAGLLLGGMLGLTISYWKQGTLSLGALRLPLVYPAILASLGLLVFILQFLMRLLKTVDSRIGVVK
jgi:TRAP-type C4-dicarboxylate transport system permease small subunit